MKKIFGLVVALVLFSGCVSSKVALTGREQVMLVSEADEKKMGSDSYQEFLSKAKLSTNQKDTQMVKKVGAKIAKVAGRDDFDWEFNLVEDAQFNAFCLPGGKVVVYTGILKIAKNESQLATVMSHEVAHALARHGAERMSHSMISSGIYSVGAMILNSKAPEYSGLFEQAYGVGTNLGVMLPYSREHEYEADEIGVKLMYKAGYDVGEAVKFWENMQKNTTTTTPEFLSTHPHSNNRIKRINEIIKEIKY